MDLSAIFNAVRIPAHDRTVEDPFAGLRVGDRLTGQVLQLETDGRVLIDLGRFQALAQATIAVQPGQVLALKVASTGVPLQLKLDTDSLAPNQRPLPQMALSALLEGPERQRLVAVIDRVLVTLRPMADDGRPDAPGGALQRPLAHDPGIAGGQLSGAPGSAPAGATTASIAQALLQIKGIFEPPPTAASIDQWTQWVRTAVEDRGVLFEIKLADALAARPLVPPGDRAAGAGNSPGDAQAGAQMADRQEANPVTVTGTGADALARAVQSIFMRDLKPHLLILQNFLGGPEDVTAGAALALKPKELAFLRQTVNHMLHHVEQQQERAVLRAGGGELFQVLAHLVPAEEGRRPVQFKVYYPKRGDGRFEPGHRIALLLDMDRLGPVRVDLSLLHNDLRILFHVRDDGVRQLLEPHAPAVAHILEGHFDHVQVITQVSQEAIARFATEDLQGPAVGRIDIQA